MFLHFSNLIDRHVFLFDYDKFIVKVFAVCITYCAIKQTKWNINFSLCVPILAYMGSGQVAPGSRGIQINSIAFMHSNLMNSNSKSISVELATNVYQIATNKHFRIIKYFACFEIQCSLFICREMHPFVSDNCQHVPTTMAALSCVQCLAINEVLVVMRFEAMFALRKFSDSIFAHLVSGHTDAGGELFDWEGESNWITRRWIERIGSVLLLVNIIFA